MIVVVSWLACHKIPGEEVSGVFWGCLLQKLVKLDMNMESLSQKSLERVLSQKALQMGSSFPCQICVVGFLSGICLTSLFLAALTSLGTFEFGGISFSALSVGNPPWNSSSPGNISE